MNLPPKLITILCFLQLFVVAACFLLTRAFLKIYDNVVPAMLGSYAPSIPLLAQFVRTDGLWFLLIPPLWCVLAAARGRVTDDASISPFMFVSGIALTIALALIFTLSAAYAFRVSFTPI
jgi:hypothetical protein